MRTFFQIVFTALILFVLLSVGHSLFANSVSPYPATTYGDLPYPQPDVVILIMDDVGVYDLDRVPTPNLDALSARGVTFTNAYAHAWCQPTRTSLMLGEVAPRWAGQSCKQNPTDYRAGTPSLAQMANLAGFGTVHVGKWHQGQNWVVGGWELSPHFLGFARTRALVPTITPDAGCGAFTRASRGDDGLITDDPTHKILRERDALLQAYADAKANGERFFGVVGFDEAHAPWEIPPAEVLPSWYTPSVDPGTWERYEAEIMALDFVIGEIVAAVGPNTWVFVLGDNGTPNPVTPKAFKDKSKLTVFERGIRVPLIVAGPFIVEGQVSDALVHAATDLIPTLADGLGVVAPWAEGVSFAGVLGGVPNPVVRSWLYVQRGTGREQAVVEKRWKMHYDKRYDLETFYDLWVDPLEENPLRPFQVPKAVRNRLRTELAEARS